MTPNERLLDLLMLWHEANSEGRLLTPEMLVPDDEPLQALLREAINKQQKMQRAFQSTIEITEPEPTEDPPEALPVVPGYELVRLIGRGGMGSVYEAYDQQLKRIVAIKVLLAEYATNPTAKARFLREARSAAALKDDHIVTIHSVSETNNSPFIVMEYLQGQSLDQRIKTSTIPIHEIMLIGQQICRGLHAAHAHGLIHRDIKPGNIWLEATTGRVKLLDFGLARSIQQETELTRTGIIVGTPAYRAPEQARNMQIDHRSDLFSLGAVLYYMTTGKRPFKGKDTYGILTSLAMDTPQAAIKLNPQVPEALSHLIDRLLAKNPADRPQTAVKVESILAKLIRNEAVTVAPVTPLLPTIEALPSEAVWDGIDVTSTELQSSTVVQHSRSHLLTLILSSFVILLCSVSLGYVIWNRTRTNLDNQLDTQTGDSKDGNTTRPASGTSNLQQLLPLRPAQKAPVVDIVTNLDHLQYDTHVPMTERFAWQPKELVAVVGTHQHKIFGGINYFIANIDETKVLAASGSSNYMILLDVIKNEEMIVSHPATGFTHDGKRLVYGNESFPPETPFQNRIKYPINGHIYEFLKADVVLAAHDSQIGIWEIGQGVAKLLKVFPNATTWAVSPNRQWVLIRHGTNFVIYDCNLQYKQLHEFRYDTDRVSFTLSNTRLALQTDEKTTIWNLDSKGVSIHHITTDAIRNGIRLSLSADGSRMFVNNQILDLSTPDLKVIAEDATKSLSSYTSFFVNNNQSLVLAIANTLSRASIRDNAVIMLQGKLPDNYMVQPHQVALSPKGRFLTCSSYSHGHTLVGRQSIFDLSPDWQQITLPSANHVNHALFLADGSRLWLDHQLSNAKQAWGLQSYSIDTPLNVNMIENLRQQLDQDDTFHACTVSPDGSLVAGLRLFPTTSMIVLKQVVDGQLKEIASINTKFATQRYVSQRVQFNRTGQYLIAYGENNQNKSDVCTWAITDKGLQEIQRFTTDAHARSLLHIDQQDRAYISDVSNGLIQFDFKTGKASKTFPQLPRMGSFDISGDGQWLIASRARRDSANFEEIRLFHLATGNSVHFWEFPGTIDRLLFHPDGRHIICFNSNGTIYILRVTPLLKP